MADKGDGDDQGEVALDFIDAEFDENGNPIKQEGGNYRSQGYTGIDLQAKYNSLKGQKGGGKLGPNG